MTAGAWDLAAETAQDLSAHDPSYGGTHYLLALMAEHNGRTADAVRELELAARAWKGADPDFADLAEVTRRLARLRKQARSPATTDASRDAGLTRRRRWVSKGLPSATTSVVALKKVSTGLRSATTSVVA